MIGLRNDLKNPLDAQRMGIFAHLGHGQRRLLGAVVYIPHLPSPTTHISGEVDLASGGGIAYANTGRLRRK